MVASSQSLTPAQPLVEFSGEPDTISIMATNSAAEDVEVEMPFLGTRNLGARSALYLNRGQSASGRQYQGAEV